MSTSFMSHELLFFGGFIVFIILMLAADLGVFNKGSKEIKLKQAAILSSVWVFFAISFYVVLRIWGNELHDIQTFEQLIEINERHLHKLTFDLSDFEGSLQLYKNNLALEYITGYIVEYALSIDNIFVMLLIFSSFGVAPANYHKVLVWGILGAVVLRFVFIFLGSALITKFSWILYIFGIFLVYSGFMMFLKRNEKEKIDTENHPMVKLASRLYRVYPQFVQDRFFHYIDGKRYITPLFLVLIMIEASDVVFAVDSIPAIFSITQDPYIVFFSNIFAILGLRSMFFLLVNVIHKFYYLKTGLSFLLVYIGLKMLLVHWLEKIGFTTSHSLIIILGILSLSVIASLLFPKKESVH